MNQAQEITVLVASGGDERVAGSFRIERNVMTVRHHASGRIKRIPLSPASHAETIARVVLLEIHDEHGKIA